MNLNALWERIEEAMARVGRTRARRELLALSDRTLADAGFSRALLEVDAWPWRAPTDTPSPRRLDLVRGRRELSIAAAELRAYNDRDLGDLGIARRDIDRVVRDGRPQDDRRQAA